MSLVCTRMSPLCHSYVLVSHLYVTRIYSYNSNALGFTTKNNADRDNGSILQEGTELPDKRSSTIEKKNIFILGDSMVKHIYGWEMNKKLNNKHKVFVRSFSGAKTTCMRDYIKPCLRENSPEHVVLHVGTNNLQ